MNFTVAKVTSLNRLGLKVYMQIMFKAEHKELSKTYMIKYYITKKAIHFFMFLANFIFAVLHLKIHPAVHLNTSKALKSL